MIKSPPPPSISPRFTEKRRSASQLAAPAQGLWNPDPALVQWAASLEVHDGSGIDSGPSFLSHSRKAHENTSWKPAKSDWVWGENHWPGFYFDFTPVQVNDLCGGVNGMTKWVDVSEHCATWVVGMLRCMQGCNTMHR